jgi:hypothetical protein
MELKPPLEVRAEEVVGRRDVGRYERAPNLRAGDQRQRITEASFVFYGSTLRRLSLWLLAESHDPPCRNTPRTRPPASRGSRRRRVRRPAGHSEDLSDVACGEVRRGSHVSSGRPQSPSIVRMMNWVDEPRPLEEHEQADTESPRCGGRGGLVPRVRAHDSRCGWEPHRRRQWRCGRCGEDQTAARPTRMRLSGPCRQRTFYGRGHGRSCIFDVWRGERGPLHSRLVGPASHLVLRVRRGGLQMRTRQSNQRALLMQLRHARRLRHENVLPLAVGPARAVRRGRRTGR